MADRLTHVNTNPDGNSDVVASRESDPNRSIQVRVVESRRDLNRFVRVPWRVYKDDPIWTPPLLFDVKEFLNPKKHPFYKHGEAVQFIALDGGEPVGRLLVSDDPRFNEQNDTNQGCFGMFESLNDEAIAHALFDAGADWLRARGRDHVMGPIDYSTNYSCGLLVDGFETPSRYMMPYNPRYYEDLFKSWGMKKNRDLYSWWFEDRFDMIDKWRRRADWISKKGKVTIRSFSKNKKEFQNEVDRCHKVYDASRKDWWWACVTLTREEIEYFAKQLAMFGIEEQVLFAETEEGEAVGFAITMPDVNEAIKPLNGRLTWYGIPWNLFRLLRRIKRVKTARMMVLCVDEKYRRRGVAELLIMRTLDYGKNTIGYTGAELGWTDEENDKINKIVERVGAERYKMFRVFERDLS